MNKTIINGVEYRHFDHLYAVSREGVALNLKKMVIAEPWIANGYYGIGRKRMLHRMVAICWLDLDPNLGRLIHVHHKDENPLNNHADNLELVTPKDHAHKHPGRGKQHMPESAKIKLRNKRLGIKHSKETKDRISQSLKAHRNEPWKNNGGHLHTKATKEKMSKNSPRNTKCCIEGIIYPSFTFAGKARNERPLTLRKRCLSDNFPEYQVIKD